MTIPYIPRCMSTQHPDNVNLPFFTENADFGGNDEIQEAYYVFSHLNCDEQMWDCEGKEVDNFVVKKLLSKYENYFKEKKLGKDIFLTLRVPNPQVEKAEAKILLETLESIPRSFDAAKLFYGEYISPIFEVILPMCQSAQSLDRIYRYYEDFVAGKQNKILKNHDVTIADWIGEFKPEKINIIPLFEDRDTMINCHNLTKEYLKDKDVSYQRVFLARSDPALNYGLVSATLLNKIALKNLYRLSAELGIKIFPIVGAGSAPFRGNLRPENVDQVANEFPSVQTFTLQSSFKYDNPPNQVEEAIKKLLARETFAPREIDEAKALDIVERYSQTYQKQIANLADIINKVAKYIPSRRKRKLHIGLFGYSRNLEGVKLPRAITFTAALYSIGLPPELLGLNALTKKDLEYLKKIYVHFDDDLSDALKFFNPNCPFIPENLKETLKEYMYRVETNQENLEITDYIAKAVIENKNGDLTENVLRAANLRKFLG